MINELDYQLGFGLVLKGTKVNIQNIKYLTIIVNEMIISKFQIPKSKSQTNSKPQIQK
jgi:hypothetical protein